MQFSVIVPVYKVEEYLERCVDSILAQTYPAFEVILVDNCSEDNTLSMMKDICHNDGITVVMICHDLNIAAKYSDRILMMSEGTIWADGTPEEVITESNLKKVYDVNSKVVFDEARPHIIVRDGEDSSSEKELLA